MPGNADLDAALALQQQTLQDILWDLRSRKPDEAFTTSSAKGEPQPEPYPVDPPNPQDASEQQTLEDNLEGTITKPNLNPLMATLLLPLHKEIWSEVYVDLTKLMKFHGVNKWVTVELSQDATHISYTTPTHRYSISQWRVAFLKFATCYSHQHL